MWLGSDVISFPGLQRLPTHRVLISEKGVGWGEREREREGERENKFKLSGVSHYKATDLIIRALHSWLHLNLIIFQRLHLQIPSHGGVRASTYE